MNRQALSITIGILGKSVACGRNISNATTQGWSSCFTGATVFDAHKVGNAMKVRRCGKWKQHKVQENGFFRVFRHISWSQGRYGNDFVFYVMSFEYKFDEYDLLGDARVVLIHKSLNLKINQCGIWCQTLILACGVWPVGTVYWKWNTSPPGSLICLRVCEVL
jgi:hypothetical protein